MFFLMLSQIWFLDPLILGSQSWSSGHVCVLSCLLFSLPLTVFFIQWTWGFSLITILWFSSGNWKDNYVSRNGTFYKEEKGNFPNMWDVRKLSSFKNMDSYLVKFALKTLSTRSDSKFDIYKDFHSGNMTSGGDSVKKYLEGLETSV